ncbi:hypothetical protein KC19_6G123300 [Ceratodon purpureus]|uniref:Uncharacterized protein n=1 Tax=Ceratodon purpureus TaxID=3225 RepID=A0A8T0HDL6_CERPU|nr:hypothetical protein KC19_6G123300 [Ceratodon purpureus]
MDPFFATMQSLRIQSGQDCCLYYAQYTTYDEPVACHCALDIAITIHQQQSQVALPRILQLLRYFRSLEVEANCMPNER